MAETTETGAKQGIPSAGRRNSEREASEAPPAPPRRGLSTRAKRIGVVVILLLLIGGWAYWYLSSRWESTDDAQVDGHIAAVSARIAGYVTKVFVDDNQYVKAGTPLVQVDPQDYVVVVSRAKADLADAEATARAMRIDVPITSTTTGSEVSSAQADVQNAEAGIAAAKKQYTAAEAQLVQAQANNFKAQSDLQRYKQLADKQEISQQQYDQAVAAARASEAAVTAAQASASAAQEQIVQAQGKLEQGHAGLRTARTAPQQIGVSRAKAAAAQAAVLQREAAVQQAELNLSYTTIAAPIDGIVNKSVQVGMNVQPGQQLMAIVPVDNIWVTANYKETQLKNMRPGQYAEIRVDAYGRTYKGRVDSIAGGSGAAFSLLPPENATGNYVKVVQRVPVKIVFDPDQEFVTDQKEHHLLRVGMSVEPKVRVK